MSESMVERVARAIDDAMEQDLPDLNAMARAAIAAMREPTRGMRAAVTSLGSFNENYQAMLHEALK
jgi:hypothetical protein